MNCRREVLLQLEFPESGVSKIGFTLSPTNKNGNCNKLWLEFQKKKKNELKKVWGNVVVEVGQCHIHGYENKRQNLRRCIEQR